MLEHLRERIARVARKLHRLHWQRVKVARITYVHSGRLKNRTSIWKVRLQRWRRQLRLRKKLTASGVVATAKAAATGMAVATGAAGLAAITTSTVVVIVSDSKPGSAGDSGSGSRLGFRSGSTRGEGKDLSSDTGDGYVSSSSSDGSSRYLHPTDQDPGAHHPLNCTYECANCCALCIAYDSNNSEESEE